MNEKDLIIKVRQRLGIPASEGPRILTLISASLEKLAREVSNDYTKRDLLLTDKTAVTAAITNTNFDYFADLSTVITTNGVMLDYLEYGTTYYAPAAGAFTTTFSIDRGQKTGHGFYAGLKVRVSTTGVLPTGLVVNTDYYVSVITADRFYFHATRTDALAGTAIVALDDDGTGTHTITPWEQETVQFSTREFGDLTSGIPVTYIYAWLVGSKLFTNALAGTFSFATPFVPTISTLPAKLESDFVDTVVKLFSLQSETGDDSK